MTLDVIDWDIGALGLEHMHNEIGVWIDTHKNKCIQNLPNRSMCLYLL